LDRSFEGNRVALAPEQSGNKLELGKKADLSRIARSASLPVPRRASLHREGDQDLVSSLTLSWSAAVNPDALAKLLPPLWSACGSPRVDGADDSEGGSLTFTWADEKTRLLLRVPFDEKGPELVLEDARGPRELKERLEAARRFDAVERKARLDKGNAQV